MKLLDRHILRELIGPFFFGVAAFTSIMFAGGELFKITELIAEYNASLLTAGKLVLLIMPSLVVMTLPMSMLLAALLGFGRLSGDSEVIALFASGTSLYRITIPVIIMSVLVTGGSFVLSEIVAPKATSEYTRIIKSAKSEVTTSRKPMMGQDLVNGETRSIYYIRGGIDAARGIARDVVVLQYNANKPFALIYGKEAVWNGNDHPNEWLFKDGYMNGLGPGQSFAMPFKHSKVTINKTPDQLELYDKKPDEMSFSKLREYIAMLQNEGQDDPGLRVRLYQKISLPLASLVFALIGAPLGLRPQRSSSAMGLGLSIVIIFAYWVLTHYMSILGENGTLSPVAASFIPTLGGIGAGIALIIKAAK
ncbi:MAG TPA: LptF/LptG family permease [Armatimonadota bacterium]|jgi:lipopolysaccharide export system permease protein